MSPGPAAALLLAFVGFYPVVTSGLWIAGGFVFRLCDEPPVLPAAADWPGVTLLIPAHNEEPVIARCVAAARAVDYPELEVLVLDDGSSDDTVATATAAAAGDDRVEVVQDPINRGKAERLNRGFARARHELVVATDADTQIHPLAVKLLVARLLRSPRIAAVAGAPHVTNRENLLCAVQVMESASIIGLIRRTQALAGRVGVVAGVLGLFRRDAVLAVGGYRGEMSTEDIDLSWRLLLAGWHTAYEPEALVGMVVPSRLRALWMQRRRWARGQGEVLRSHAREILCWRNRKLWPLLLEGIASLAWVVLLVVVEVVLLVATAVAGSGLPTLDAVTLLLGWGVAVAVVATVQLAFALKLDFTYDRTLMLAVLLAPLYPIAYWMISAAAALRSELPALVRGAGERRVVWDIPRERL